MSISVRSDLLKWVLWIKGRGGQRVELLYISKVMQLLVEIMVCKDVKYSYRNWWLRWDGGKDH